MSWGRFPAMGLGFTLDNVITISLKRNHHKLLITSPHPFKKTETTCERVARYLHYTCSATEKNTVHSIKEKSSSNHRNLLTVTEDFGDFHGKEMIIQFRPSGEEWNADQRFSRRGFLCLRQSLTTPEQDVQTKSGGNNPSGPEKSFTATFLSVKTCLSAFISFLW